MMTMPQAALLFAGVSTAVAGLVCKTQELHLASIGLCCMALASLSGYVVAARRLGA